MLLELSLEVTTKYISKSSNTWQPEAVNPTARHTLRTSPREQKKRHSSIQPPPHPRPETAFALFLRSHVETETSTNNKKEKMKSYFWENLGRW
jgi:hypothetical protein